MAVQSITTRRGSVGAGALGALCALAVVVLPGGAASAGPATECANATATPGEVGSGKLRRAITCLIAEERAAAGRRALRTNLSLKRAAQRHTNVMLDQDCFKHQCRGEAPAAKRVERSGYLRPGDRYGFGQNLGYAPTPKSMVDSWMKSSFHRRNILKRRFRHIGVGAGRGVPVKRKADRKFVTYTVLFAWRRR